MTSVPAELPADDHLAEATAGLGRRLRLPPEKYLHYAGAVLVPVGLVLIILGWLGTSRTSRVYEQMPYVISGGLLGVGLVFAGGFAYFAYWMTRVVDLDRERATVASGEADRTAAALERIEELLRDVTGQGATLVATKGGTMVHRATCPMVAGREDLRRVDAASTKLTPCQICDPLAT